MSRLQGLQRKSGVAGHDSLLGKTATVVGEFNGVGRVEINGAFWNAEGDPGLTAGDKVIIKAIDGLTLSIEKNQE